MEMIKPYPQTGRKGVLMEDREIVALYFRRDETAIGETEIKYGRYLYKTAYNILGSMGDSKESVNDTLLAAWDSIPPNKPEVLSTYLGKLTRRISINMVRKRTRQKRGGSQYNLSFSELEECIPSVGGPEREMDDKLLADAINAFLRALAPEAREVFVGRYYFMDPIRKVAGNHGMSQSKAKSMLHRTRLGLREHLEKEGFTI